MSTQIIKVPDIGGAEGVEVIEICVAPGDQVAREDSLVVVESDKASMEIPSPVAGTVISINVADGDNISEGDTILELKIGASEADTKVDNSEHETVVAINTDTQAPTQVIEPPVEPPMLTETIALDTILETISIPDLGGGGDAEVIEVCVIIGDEVDQGDSLIVLETDKASIEVPSPKAGIVMSVSIKEGDKVSEGSAILGLEVVATPKQPEQTPVQVSTPQKTIESTKSPEPIVSQETNESVIPAPAFSSPIPAHPVVEETKFRTGEFYAGPAVRKLARELGVNLATVKGSGPKERIAKDDLKHHVKQVLQSPNTTTQSIGIAPVPDIDFSAFGEITQESLSKIQKITAANMQRNWLNIPHVTQFDEADISDLEDFRQSLKEQAKKRGVKITPLAFLLKACACVLANNPKFNASLHSDGEQIILKNYIHIGVAVDTEAGLVVPVIRDVDKKSIWELAQESAELAAKAKARKLKLAEMQGGCFTISSLGGIGGQGFTPIVNAPEVGILGVSKLAVKPVWNGSEFIPRKMLPLSLSYDHRAVNGVDGGKFLTELNQSLSDIRRLVL
ncbi:MAG: dihydrolipoyllysine-residue acetyltransferase [Spongiibacteraceae bacterium]|nr:dihydrolipoyllysine-residue acetyltransferase [Spongiibacteraceae bacterium]